MFAVEDELPVSGRQRRHNFATAATGALVHDSPVLQRYVEDAFLGDLRDELNEAVGKLAPIQKQISALTILLKLVVKVQSWSPLSSR